MGKGGNIPPATKRVREKSCSWAPWSFSILRIVGGPSLRLHALYFRVHPLNLQGPPCILVGLPYHPTLTSSRSPQGPREHGVRTPRHAMNTLGMIDFVLEDIIIIKRISYFFSFAGLASAVV